MSRPHAVRRIAQASLFLALGVPCAARADDPAQEESRAQLLYDRAMLAMRERRFDTACRTLEEVAKVLPESIPARIAVAECYLRSDRLATALELYRPIEAEAFGRLQWSRSAQARARTQALNARAARLLVRVPARVSAVPGLEIRCDGELTARATWNTPIPIDAGRHELEVTAPGKAPLVRTIVVDEDDVTFAIDIAMPAALAPPRSAALAPASTPDVSVPTLPVRREGSAMPGIVMLGTGAIALTIGAVTGGLAVGMASDARRGCLDGVCSPSSDAAAGFAGALGVIATAELVIGGLVTAGGVVLLVTRPFGRGSAPVSAAVGPGSVWLTGTF